MVRRSDGDRLLSDTRKFSVEELAAVQGWPAYTTGALPASRVAACRILGKSVAPPVMGFVARLAMARLGLLPGQVTAAVPPAVCPVGTAYDTPCSTPDHMASGAHAAMDATHDHGPARAARLTREDAQAHTYLGMGAKPPHIYCPQCDGVGRQDGYYEPQWGCSGCGYMSEAWRRRRLQQLMGEDVPPSPCPVAMADGDATSPSLPAPMHAHGTGQPQSAAFTREDAGQRHAVDLRAVMQHVARLTAARRAATPATRAGGPGPTVLPVGGSDGVPSDLTAGATVADVATRHPKTKLPPAMTSAPLGGGDGTGAVPEWDWAQELAMDSLFAGPATATPAWPHGLP